MDVKQLAGQKFDEYQLIKLIGEGGMSAVYHAHQTELDRDVAIKILAPRFGEDANYSERFIREAKMAASLEHPHIVPIYDYGTYTPSESSEPLSFVAMRLLRGGSLWDYLNSGRRLSLSETAALAGDLGKALDYAHRRGIIHRDIKPSNIMFDENGIVYLVDFGIAKAVQTDMGLTADNVVLGTPPYISPEQWRGESLTPAVDQYALAAIVYEIVTGKAPFEAPTPHSAMNRHLNEIPQPAHLIGENIPPAVSQVLTKALAKTPEERYETVGDFAAALREAVNDQPAQPPAEPVTGFEATQLSRPAGAPLTDTQQANPPVPPEPRVYTPPRTAPHLRRQPSNDNVMRRAIIGAGIGALILAAALCIGALALLSSFNNDNDDNATAVPEVVVQGSENAPTAFSDITLIPTDEIVTTDELSITATDLPPLNGGTEELPPTADLATGIVTTETEEANSEPTTQPVNLDPAALREAQMLHNQPEEPVRDTAFSPDGQMVASAHGDGAIRLWHDVNSTPLTLLGHTGVATAVDFSPDGLILASSSEDGSIRLWDTQTGGLRQTLTGHGGAVRDLDFSPDGLRLVSAGEDNTVRLWDPQTGAPLQTMTSDNRWLSVAFSPDGSLIASGGANAQIALWETATGVQVQSLPGHNEEVRSIDFSPDGRRLASSSTDNTIRVWDLQTGETIYTLGGHGRDVWVVKFSPDSRFLASGGRDNNLRIWDMNTGGELANLTGHTGWVIGADFSPSGDALVTGSGDGSVRLWRMTG
jgi:eukaryotic-like serine/threonine-protein kinase